MNPLVFSTKIVTNLPNAGKFLAINRISSNIFTRNIKTTSVKLEDRPSFAHILEKNSLTEEDKQAIRDEVAKKTEGWITYGYSKTDPEYDKKLYRNDAIKLIGFLGLFFGWLFYYMPGKSEYNWAMTEAQLEIERRKLNNLPLVDKNFINPDRIQLPSDEELGKDFKITI